MDKLKNKLADQLISIAAGLKNSIDQQENSQNILINPLAPKVITDEKELKKIQPYLNNLEASLDHQDVFNIALMGGYGSGKSTILKTFQHIEKYKSKYDFLNLSLASFDDKQELSTKKGEDDEKLKEDEPIDKTLERRLEISILQQLFYQVRPNRIPESRFKRIVTIGAWKLFLISLAIVIWLYSAFYLMYFGNIDKWNPRSWNREWSFDYSTAFFSLLFLIGIVCNVGKLYRVLKHSKINKVSIKGELEIGQSADKSIFNQHLEEILYFFEKTHYNVVVIEDIDRFNGTNIFTKLRELNTLINKSETTNRMVKFVYAIKDDKFANNHDRVKFFDHIIPVIPFVNSVNANEQLNQLLAENNLINLLSHDFTNDILTFIDDIDMRLLINVFQEFQVYREILNDKLSQGNTQEKHDKLFACLIYKNIDPSDYGNLLKRSGKLYDFFLNKSKYTEKFKEELENKIIEIDDQIVYMRSLSLNDVKELRAVYVNCLISELKFFHSFYFENHIDNVEVLADEYFEHLLSGEYKYCEIERTTTYNPPKPSAPKNAPIGIVNIESLVNTKYTYAQREKLIRDKENDGIYNANKERESLKSQIRKLESLSIQEIFRNRDMSVHLSNFGNSKLLTSLLLNGYINEDYEDYISLFHGISITKNDLNFEQSVKSGIKLEPEYQLEKIENLIKRIPAIHFSRQAIWNYDLLNYLLQSQPRHSAKYNQLLDTLQEDETHAFDFIHGFFIKRVKNASKFLKDIIVLKPNFLSRTLQNPKLLEDEIRSICRMIFEFIPFETLIKFESIQSLDEYLANLSDLLHFYQSLNSKVTLEKYIELRNVKFIHLKQPLEDQKHIFEKICLGSNYQITEANVKEVLKYYNSDFDHEKYERSQFSVIQNQSFSQIKSYVLNNIDSFVRFQNDDQYNDEFHVLSVASNPRIEFETKSKFLEKQRTKISSLKLINQLEILQLVFKLNLVVPNWENIIYYWGITGNEEIDETLANELNKEVVYMKLKGVNITEFEEYSSYYDSFSEAIISCGRLNLDAYMNLLISLPITYPDFAESIQNPDDITDENFSALIAMETIDFTSENFAYARTRGIIHSSNFLITYLDKFIKNINDYALNELEWINILSSEEITDTKKFELILRMPDLPIVNNQEIAEIILNTLPLDKVSGMSFEKFNKILSVNSSEKKIQLLLANINQFNNEELQKLVETIDSNYEKIFLKKHKPTYIYDPHFIQLLKELEKRGLIKRFEVFDDNTEVKVYANY